MDDTPQITENTSGEYSSKLYLAIFGVIMVIVVGYLAYGYGKGQNTDKDVLMASTTQLSQTPTQAPQEIPATSDYTVPNNANTAPPTVAAANTTTCAKTGFAQKWEYLTSYEVKANETLQSIATEQLKDATRVNEILQLNGVGPLVVGSTLYLPPPTIPKSSGNLRQVYGKILEKNAASWQVGFSSDPKGQGIVIPSFWFENIPNRNSFTVGSCVKIFFDDGFTVYSVALQ